MRLWAVALGIFGAALWLFLSGNDEVSGIRPAAASNDPVARGCALGPNMLERIGRGYHPAHSEDVTIVPRFPNYWGTFDVTSHSGPWDHLQRVPLVLYGPGYIEPTGSVVTEATLADVYPSASALLDANLPPRTGRPLTKALVDAPSPPKLIVTVMWDGVGRNVLERWPDRWPTLARLEREGISYYEATVGSSPSITPSAHSTLGTGAFPDEHGVTGIEFRTDEGAMTTSFRDREPKQLLLTTFADEYDLAVGNASKVGLLGWREWHLGMLGHGTATPGGDRDEVALIGPDGKVIGNPAYYSTPGDLKNQEEVLEGFLDEADRSDGQADGAWRGHELYEYEDNPGWVRYQSYLLQRMIERGEYGADEVPDLLFTNFKMTDIAGHQYTMDSTEMAENLEAQDDALAALVEQLDTEVGDYALILSADHGHTPSEQRSGAWAIQPGEFRADIDRHFEVTDGSSLVLTVSAVGPFLDRDVMAELDVTASEIAEFLNGYTIRDNWPSDEDLPSAFTERGPEQVLSAAFPPGDLPAIQRCREEL